MMHRRLVLIVLAVFPMAMAGCGGPAEQNGTDAPAATRDTDTVAHMHEHFERLRDVQEAVIRGDLEGAREPANRLANHEELAALPTGEFVTELRTTARQIAAADSVEVAAQGAAQLVATCGSCHTASNLSVSMPEAVIPAPTDDRAGHMRQHQAAVDLLYRGLAAPSDENWTKGAEMLRHAPLAADDLADVAKEAHAAAARVHELAGRALAAAHQDARVAVYGELIGTCASCHGLHGKVWGPGVPRTE